ncbi:kinase-like protein [Ascoidea rubescens DSM 1968]|uniref:Kinase-like protein n=1 Tax=Ascoidea rubescens DSM 1968 TaxID=1344418 RepID=A0A1D2VFT9_9ASCO|nr:kinase-like protein [Ascoidea rubescens DSM 1968]ODV60544.1 kinase-like protein [Ascoidea rubescens DSM 1968]
MGLFSSKKDKESRKDKDKDKDKDKKHRKRSSTLGPIPLTRRSHSLITNDNRNNSIINSSKNTHRNDRVSNSNKTSSPYTLNKRSNSLPITTKSNLGKSLDISRDSSILKPNKTIPKNYGLPSIDSYHQKPPKLSINSIVEMNTKSKFKSDTNHNSVLNLSNANPNNNGSDNNNPSGILPLPLKDPNEFLPTNLLQEYQSLNDIYIFPNNNFNDSKNLGSGSSAVIKLVLNKKNRNVKYALKILKLFKSEYNTPLTFYKRISKEFIISKIVSNNKHVITTANLLKIPTTTQFSRSWGLTLEFCSNGDLFGLIIQRGFKNVKIELKYCLFKQITLGLKFLHNMDIIHRDLKPENVLINEHGICKITDFGVSDFGHEIIGNLESPIKKYKTFLGSPPYVPPEVFKFSKKLSSKEIANTKGYDGFKMDCWSLGMILFAIIYQNTPFIDPCTEDPNYKKYFNFIMNYQTNLTNYSNGNISNGNSNSNSSSSGNMKSLTYDNFKWVNGFKNNNVKKIALGLVNPIEEKRIGLDDIFKDEWFKKVEMCMDEKDEEYDLKYYEIDGKNSRNKYIDYIPIREYFGKSSNEKDDKLKDKNPNSDSTEIDIKDNKNNEKMDTDKAGKFSMIDDIENEHKQNRNSFNKMKISIPDYIKEEDEIKSVLSKIISNDVDHNRHVLEDICAHEDKHNCKVESKEESKTGSNENGNFSDMNDIISLKDSTELNNSSDNSEDNSDKEGGSSPSTISSVLDFQVKSKIDVKMKMGKEFDQDPGKLNDESHMKSMIPNDILSKAPAHKSQTSLQNGSHLFYKQNSNHNYEPTSNNKYGHKYNYNYSSNYAYSYHHKQSSTSYMDSNGNVNSEESSSEESLYFKGRTRKHLHNDIVNIPTIGLGGSIHHNGFRIR